MKKNKILISANVLFTITNFRKDLIKYLLEKEFEVVCVANTDELSSNALSFLDSLNIKFIQVDISRKGVNPIEDLKYMFTLKSIYKNEKPDAILHFTIKPNIYGTLASKLAGVPSINTINGLGSAIIHNNFLSKILKLMYGFSLRFSEKVLFQNNDDLDFFVSKRLVSKNKTSIVPGSGVDTSSFEMIRRNSKDLTFLLVARLLKDKGIYEYINAIKTLKQKGYNCKFLIGGPFDFANPSAISKNEVSQWESSELVEYIGKTNNIKEFLRLADVIVLPSYREGLSRFLIEAASSSKPIITTNVAGCKDVVDDNINGYLCEVKDDKSLASCIEKMLLLPENDLNLMRQHSKRIAKERFDSTIVNKIYYKEISQLCFIH